MMTGVNDVFDQSRSRQLFDIAHLVRHPNALEQATRFIVDGVMIIEAGKIRALHTREAGRHHVPPSVLLSHFPGKLIVPGFIDCHVHYPQTEMIGAWGSLLLDWLNYSTFPTESQYHCADHAAAMLDFFLQELLRYGTTSALVFATVHGARGIGRGAINRGVTAEHARHRGKSHDGPTCPGSAAGHAGAKRTGYPTAD